MYFISNVFLHYYLYDLKNLSHKTKSINNYHSKPVIDILFKGRYNAVDVIRFIPSGRLENNYIIKEVRNIIKKINIWDCFINLSPLLLMNDYSAMAELMNACDSKYGKFWEGYSDTDNIHNMQKLALFKRTLDISKQKNTLFELEEPKWKSIVTGTVSKPRDAIAPFLQYKADSTEINNALSANIMEGEARDFINIITDHINKYPTEDDFTTYRGDKTFGLLTLVKHQYDENLAEKVEKFTQNIDSKTDEEIKEFADKYINGQKVEQPRFLSTAMHIDSTKKYARKIRWKISVPKGTKGLFIESYNIGRENESEFLIQRESKIKINKAMYNRVKKLWEFEGVIIQDMSIDKYNNSV